MKCGNCNVDFQNLRANVAHMLVVHGSQFDPEEPSHERLAKVQAELMKDDRIKGAMELAGGI